MALRPTPRAHLWRPDASYIDWNASETSCAERFQASIDEVPPTHATKLPDIAPPIRRVTAPRLDELHPHDPNLTDMILCILEPCSLCSAIEHLIHEVDFHIYYMQSTAWNASDAHLKGRTGKLPRVEISELEYHRGKFSTGRTMEREHTVRSLRTFERLTSRYYLDNKNLTRQATIRLPGEDGENGSNSGKEDTSDATELVLDSPAGNTTVPGEHVHDELDSNPKLGFHAGDVDTRSQKTPHNAQEELNLEIHPFSEKWEDDKDTQQTVQEDLAPTCHHLQTITEEDEPPDDNTKAKRGPDVLSNDISATLATPVDGDHVDSMKEEHYSFSSIASTAQSQRRNVDATYDTTTTQFSASEAPELTDNIDQERPCSLSHTPSSQYSQGTIIAQERYQDAYNALEGRRHPIESTEDLIGRLASVIIHNQPALLAQSPVPTRPQGLYIPIPVHSLARPISPAQCQIRQEWVEAPRVRPLPGGNDFSAQYDGGILANTNNWVYEQEDLGREKSGFRYISKGIKRRIGKIFGKYGV